MAREVCRASDRGSARGASSTEVVESGEGLHAVLVSDTTSTQSTASADVAADICTGRAMAPQTPYPASVSCATLARHDPRQEPGAVVPYAGICAGGAG
jgi:hypothetical protein